MHLRSTSCMNIFISNYIYVYKQTQVQPSELKEMLMLILKLSFLFSVGIIERKYQGHNSLSEHC